METTLNICIDSILNQSFKDFEIICVDDNSTDGSNGIVKRYQKSFPNTVKYIKSYKNGGPGHARNIGLKEATGEYISFIDADDWIDSNFYSVVLDAINKTDSQIAIVGVKNEFDNILSSQIRYNYSYINVIDNEYAINLLTRRFSNDTYISPMVCQKIYSRSFLQKSNVKFKSNSYYEDDLFTFELLLNKSKIVLVPNVYYHYYQRPCSITHSFSKKHILDLSFFIKDLHEYLIEHNLMNKYYYSFLSFCQKTIRSVIALLLQSEQNNNTQKEYIKLLIQKTTKIISIYEWVDFLDTNILKNLLEL